MAKILIVAYQTAGGRPLHDAMADLTHRDPDTEFRLLVPATRVQHLLTWTEGESMAIARTTAERIARELASSGYRLDDVVVGNPDPFLAVTTELRERPDIDGILVSTFPPGVSRWLRLDLPSRLEKIGLPVIHVIVEQEEAEIS